MFFLITLIQCSYRKSSSGCGGSSGWRSGRLFDCSRFTQQLRSYYRGAVSSSGRLSIDSDSSGSGYESKDTALFVRILKVFLAKNYGFEWNSKALNVFSYFFDFFEGRPEEMVMCLAYMIHGTSGFTQMVAPGGEKYKSRGFLQIYSRDNYKLASKDLKKYVENPSKLEKFDVKRMSAALYVYEYHTSGLIGRSFGSIIYALRPADTEKRNQNISTYEMIYESRLMLYEDLCKEFEIRFIPGNRRFHK